ncbi:MAG TPA: AAA family ATPase [Bacillota bacterium]|nr:AAA family ATPase [Bacillota bacterium]
MEDIVSVLAATGDDILQPVLSQMADVKILGFALRGEQVIDMVEDLLPKVTIIADFMDPGMELAKELSSHFSKTRVIYIITSDQEKEIKEALVGLGIYDFLPHTFRKSELHKMIQNPRGWHHLLDEGLQLEKLIGKARNPVRKVHKIDSLQENGNQSNSRSLSSDHTFASNLSQQDSAHHNVYPNGYRQASALPMSDQGTSNSASLLSRILTRLRPSHKPCAPNEKCAGNRKEHMQNMQNIRAGQNPQESPIPEKAQKFQTQKETLIEQNLGDQQAQQRRNSQQTPMIQQIQQPQTPQTPLTSSLVEATSYSDPAKGGTKLPIKVLKQQIVTFWSAKPGTGKTFLAINTAVSLASRGARVVIVDGDLVNLSVGVTLNLMDEKRTLERALKCDHINEIEDCLLYHPKFRTLAVLSGSELCRPENYCSVTRENVEKLLEHLRLRFDVIIFDTASDLQTVTTFVALQQATRVILVANQDYAQVFATKRVFSLLNRLNISRGNNFIVLNGEVEPCRLSKNMIEDMLGIKVNLVIPSMPGPVLDSIIDSNPLILHNGSETLLIRKQLQSLADEIFPLSSEEKVSFLSSLTKLINKKGSISYG